MCLEPVTLSVTLRYVCFRVIPSTETGYGAYRSGERLSMAGSGTEHFSSKRCVHIGQNNPASCTLIKRDRRFIPQWQIGQRMKQANLCYHLVPWLRTTAVLPLTLFPLAEPAASMSTDIYVTEATYPSTVWLPKLGGWKDYIHRGPIVLHNNLQTNLTYGLPTSVTWLKLLGKYEYWHLARSDRAITLTNAHSAAL